MTSYEKQRLEELGFMNAMLERGVSADAVSVLVGDGRIEKAGSAYPEMFVQGFQEELSKSEKGRAMLKRAFDSDDLLDNIGQWAKYLGVGLLGAAAGYAVPKIYNNLKNAMGTYSAYNREKMKQDKKPNTAADNDGLVITMPDKKSHTIKNTDGLVVTMPDRKPNATVGADDDNFVTLLHDTKAP